MYFCIECYHKHKENSRIGKKHAIYDVKHNPVRERKCWKCNKELKINHVNQKYYRRFDLEKVWNSPYVELCCCSCYKYLKDKEKIKELMINIGIVKVEYFCKHKLVNTNPKYVKRIIAENIKEFRKLGIELLGDYIYNFKCIAKKKGIVK